MVFLAWGYLAPLLVVNNSEGSDVDICVEIDRPSIFTLVHIKEELEKLLKCPVDLVRLRNNMDELLRGCIDKDGIYV